MMPTLGTDYWQEDPRLSAQQAKVEECQRILRQKAKEAAALLGATLEVLRSRRDELASNPAKSIGTGFIGDGLQQVNDQLGKARNYLQSIE